MCHCSPSRPFYPACHSSLPGPRSLYRAPMLGPLQLDLAVCSSFYCVNSGLPAATLSTTISCYIFFLFFTTWQFFPSYLSPQNCQPQRSAGTLQRDSKCPPDGGMSPSLLLGAHPSQPWPPSCNLGWLKPATKKLLEGVRPGCKHHTALLVCSFGLWTASSL